METEILHNEKHFVVCIKKSGVLSEKSDGKTPGMVDILAEQLGTEIYPVHRLDREASGVMVFAKTKAGAAKLSALVSGDGFEKKYLVVVHGKPDDMCGTMKDLLFKDSKKNKSFVVTKERKGVKSASLEYECLQTKLIDDKDFSLVKVKLHTGRTHQIRVQFSSRKMPVVGDMRYGSNVRTDMCLFSHSIGFVNPFSGENVKFEAMPQGEYYELFST